MELRTTTQVAERLGVSPKVLRRFVAANWITPKYKAPGHRGAAYFDPKDVEALAKRLATEAEERAAVLRKAAS